jgi:hypothetical protein
MIYLFATACFFSIAARILDLIGPVFGDFRCKANATFSTYLLFHGNIEFAVR